MIESFDELESILCDCAKLRGCYPLMNRTNAQFFEYLLEYKREQLIPLAKDFLEHCVMLYTIKRHDSVFKTLAKGATSAHRIYTCPNCGVVEHVKLAPNEMPKCEVCGSIVNYVYEAEQ